MAAHSYADCAPFAVPQQEAHDLLALCRQGVTQAGKMGLGGDQDLHQGHRGSQGEMGGCAIPGGQMHKRQDGWENSWDWDPRNLGIEFFV